MAITYGSMGQIGRVGFYDAFYIGAASVPDVWSWLVDREFTTNQQYEEWMSLAPFGNATVVPVGDMAPEDQPSVIAAGRFDPFLIGKRWSYYVSMPEVDQYKKIKTLLPEVGKAHKHTVNQLAANLNINGFSSGNGIAAEALYGTTHTLSGTGSNRPATDVAFGPLAIQQLKQLIIAQNDQKGNPLFYGGPVMITVSALNDQFARTIMNSSYLPGTPNNDVNTARDETEIKTCLYYGSTYTGWFMRDKSKSGLARLTLKKFEHNALPIAPNYFFPHITHEILTFLWTMWQGTSATTGA